MARSRRASPSRPHSTSAPPPAHHTPPAQQQHAHQQHSHQASAAQQTPQVTNVYMQRGGGGGTGMLGTMASVAAGSVIGHGISHMMFNRDEPPAQPAQAQEVARQVGEGACAPQIKSYAKCLEANEGKPENCKWAWDYFMQCQEQQPQQE